MPLADWRDGLDHLDAASADAITDLDYLRGNVEGGEGFDWFYASTADREAGPDADHRRRRTANRGCSATRTCRTGGRTRTATAPAASRAARRRRGCRSKPIRFTEIGCPAVDRGPNQPNVFYDPKSAESFLPYFSAAGATTRCSGASSRRRSATGPSRRTTRCRASTPVG